MDGQRSRGADDPSGLDSTLRNSGAKTLNESSQKVCPRGSALSILIRGQRISIAMNGADESWVGGIRFDFLPQPRYRKID